MACLIASNHAARDEKRGGSACGCIHCADECNCDGEDEGRYDDEQPLFEPDEAGR